MLLRSQVDHYGIEHRLTLDLVGNKPGAEALVKHSLVGGMLVDKIQAFRALCDDVGCTDLPQHTQHRQLSLDNLDGPCGVTWWLQWHFASGPYPS